MSSSAYEWYCCLPFPVKEFRECAVRHGNAASPEEAAVMHAAALLSLTSYLEDIPVIAVANEKDGSDVKLYRLTVTLVTGEQA